MNINTNYDYRNFSIHNENTTPGDTGDASGKISGQKSSPEECQTCKNRKYKDGSNEANVSFKTAAHISPDAAGAAVRSHENEHVQNAYSNAQIKGGEVINASVSIHTSICPECGRSYVSGGVTNTMIRYPNETAPYQKERKAQDTVRLSGANFQTEV